MDPVRDHADFEYVRPIDLLGANKSLADFSRAFDSNPSRFSVVCPKVRFFRNFNGWPCCLGDKRGLGGGNQEAVTD